MKRIFISSLILTVALGLAAQVPDDYKADYTTLAGKASDTLFDAISTIAAKGYQTHTYKDLWTFFRTTDATEDGHVWDMYSDCTFTFGTDQCGNYSGVCSCYNREHSLPKSWFGGSDSNAPGTDLFHLYPTDGKINGDRGNLPFGECSGSQLMHYRGKVGSSQLPGYSGLVFEPDDIYKGDFARSYFAMLVRYGKSFAFNQSEGGDVMFSNTGADISAANHYGLTDYSVDMLMRWHGLDPVSEKETDRNNGIQQTQGNRNPFIDCPVLAEYFWGVKAGEALDIQDLIDCGCADSTTVDDNPPSRLPEVPFPSLTLNTAGHLLTFTCLPPHAGIAVFSADGALTDIIASAGPEASFSLSGGLYLIVVSAADKKQTFKIMLD